jgi:methionyl aminopeptidase
MIFIKTKKEIEVMREGGKILASILGELSAAAKPGTATLKLDKLARELFKLHNVRPAFLGYDGFPASICVSLNDEVVHGVPSDRVLKEGDMLSLDAGVIHKGFFTDSAVTVPVLGELTRGQWVKDNPKLNKLIETAKAALNAGIKQAKVGSRLGKVSGAIQEIVEKEGFGVIREMVGHGVGRKLHEEPQVPNYGSSEDGPRLEEGMVLAIEPMISAGDWHLIEDDLVYKTKAGSWAAHFEHTVAITKKGPKVLTK